MKVLKHPLHFPQHYTDDCSLLRMPYSVIQKILKNLIIFGLSARTLREPSSFLPVNRHEDSFSISNATVLYNFSNHSIQIENRFRQNHSLTFQYSKSQKLVDKIIHFPALRDYYFTLFFYIFDLIRSSAYPAISLTDSPYAAISDIGVLKS